MRRPRKDRRTAYLDEVAKLDPIIKLWWRRPRSDLAISDQTALDIKWHFQTTLHSMSKMGNRIRRARETAMMSQIRSFHPSRHSTIHPRRDRNRQSRPILSRHTPDPAGPSHRIAPCPFLPPQMRKKKCTSGVKNPKKIGPAGLVSLHLLPILEFCELCGEPYHILQCSITDDPQGNHRLFCPDCHPLITDTLLSILF